MSGASSGLEEPLSRVSDQPTAGSQPEASGSGPTIAVMGVDAMGGESESALLAAALQAIEKVAAQLSEAEEDKLVAVLNTPKGIIEL